MKETSPNDWTAVKPEIFPELYKIAKQVYEKKIARKDGLAYLLRENKISSVSASDYIADFRCMMEAKVYNRRLSAAGTIFFLDNILSDYGPKQLEGALKALEQHIIYYEGVSKGNMPAFREILTEYKNKYSLRPLIDSYEQLKKNLVTLETYLTDGNIEQRSFAASIITNGICFVAYELNREIRFAPSKFIGYQENVKERYNSVGDDGRETNKAISKLIGAEPMENGDIENDYIQYCSSLGLDTPSTGSFAKKRKFWQVQFEPSQSTPSVSQGFPEGRMVERMHRFRERNSKVIELAKQNFKKANKKVFCQACEFDFEEFYGELGADFIEGHHTLAVRDMPVGYETKPEEIALLCSNCHRMIHKQSRWLTVDELKAIIKK